MTRQLLINGRVFDGTMQHTGHAVLIEHGLIGGVFADEDAPRDVDIVDLDGHTLAPGFVDLQVNGGGGRLFNDAPSVEGLQTIAGAHRRFGTTSFLPTLITDHADILQRGIAAVSESIKLSHPLVRGIHLEGPHLNADYRGVHDASRMHPLDDKAFDLICSMEQGVTLVTVAPETLSAQTIGRLVDAGITVFAGHSAANYAQTQTALAAGVTGFTHLFNAMTPFTSRMPGMVGAALDDADSFFGIIADGHHVHAASLRIAVRAKPQGKACLVTDAMPTVGSTEKTFTLYGRQISAVDGRCVSEDGTLAGSDIGMIDAVRNAIEFGVADLPEALRMASAYPAAAIGLDREIGFIQSGFHADLVELDDALNVVRTWERGNAEAYV